METTDGILMFVIVAGTVLALLIVILWIILPFYVIGIRNKLEETNRLLKIMAARSTPEIAPPRGFVTKKN